ncbi:MAG: helix-turn-helix domain-containing protein [Acidimicrobiia bacterium]|nr:helix-turn-helix domain-containing protein [Acidimicrobiia bacterium]
MAKRTAIADMNCSMARALDVVGEWWTLLIVREVFFGRRNFTQMHDTLGVARNILSDRLATLVDGGVLEKRPDPNDARRSEYHLTDKGTDLLPVLVMLMQWGDKWAGDGTGPPLVLTNRATRTDVRPALIDAETGGAIDLSQLRARPGPGFRAESWPPLRSAGEAAENTA